MKGGFGRLPGFRSIRGKLMAAVVVCVLAPALLTLLLFSSLAEDAVQRQAIANAENAMKLTGASIETQLGDMLTIANHIQLNPDMTGYFKRYVRFGSEQPDPVGKFAAGSRILQQLESLSAVGDRSYISILLTDGTVFTNYSTDEFHPRRFREEAWFGELQSFIGLQSYWIPTSPTVFLYEKKNSPYQLSVARTLRLDDSTIYGYVVVTTMESRLRVQFEKVAQERRVLLVDEEGTVLSGPELSDIGSAQLARVRPADAGVPASVVVREDGGKRLVTEMRLGINGWSLVSVQPYKEAIANISQIFNRVFLAQLLLFVAMLALLVGIIRRLTYPLVHLGKAASAVQRGNLEMRTGVRGPDEIGRLGILFDQMLDRVQDMIREISAGQARKRLAELAMLQAQINPHFLFNVLNSIRMKVLRSGDADSAKMISSLSRLLRMTISREEAAITLHEEIELLRHYVELMNLRQKEGADLVLDIDADAFLVPVPRFILQPLVENALLHGLSRSGGTVRVEARLEAGGARLLLRVEDDGAGMDEPSLEGLRRRLEEPRPQEASAAEASIGLSNVGERMRLMYGEGFAIEADSSPGRGTSVTMRVPLPAARPAEGTIAAKRQMTKGEREDG
ncbi:Two-component sensor kinase YesM [Paenibacillus pasadenensis]|uniref:histidine kinase n=2 Tax=Paenibacillus TaxID=44249 RepID=A0A2N5N8Y8_9BACL|nr:sensor histidine kinase [Paenibacillus pasadenensis]PLT46760.1 Two-component sensor kinase YesM [Paenibacillus pasadenensis]